MEIWIERIAREYTGRERENRGNKRLQVIKKIKKDIR